MSCRDRLAELVERAVGDERDEEHDHRPVADELPVVVVQQAAPAEGVEAVEQVVRHAEQQQPGRKCDGQAHEPGDHRHADHLDAEEDDANG